MAVKTWTITDTEKGICNSNFCVTAEDSSHQQADWKVTQQVLHGGLCEGVHSIEIDNGLMKIVVLPTRGMGVWKTELPNGKVLGWKSPISGPVHPQYVPITDSSGLGWLEGFDEFIVRCGLESNGAPDFDENGNLLYPLHGRIANRPAHCVEVVVDDAAQTISVRGVIDEARFHFHKLRLETSITTSFHSTTFTINDTVRNYGGTTAELQMLYHINVGEPFLTPGAQVVAPVRTIEPRNAATGSAIAWDLIGDPLAGATEQCFYLELFGDEVGNTKVLLKDASAETGMSIAYDINQLPYFSVWKNMVATEDGYVVGLEPATNYPNQRSLESEKGRVVSLLPDELWSADLEIEWLSSSTQLAKSEQDIRELMNAV